MIVGGGVAILLAITVVPLVVARLEGLQGQDKFEEADRIRTSFIAIGGGALATLGAYSTYRTFDLNRSGQVTDRFSRAISQLGDTNPRVCLGGIYALERIAYDSERDHPQVMEVLTAYVRAEAPVERRAQVRPPCRDAPLDLPKHPTNELQAAVAVLGRRRSGHDKHRLDLESVDLGGAKFPRAADLRGANLNGARLAMAALPQVNLTTRTFDGQLVHTDLRGADLRGADLGGANLRGAWRRGANLHEAHLEQADLRAPEPDDGIVEAEPTGADLAHADLTDAYLEGANLEGTNLEGTNLEGSKLDRAVLKGASADAETKPKELWDELKGRGVIGLPEAVDEEIVSEHPRPRR
jgi:uncharacterized protein YjbI with pentapeptide repeats